MEYIKIYDTPLSKEEHITHSLERKILQMPVRYHLVDCFKELKHGRPMEDQEVLDMFIQYMIDSNVGAPFSEFIVNITFNNGE